MRIKNIIVCFCILSFLAVSACLPNRQAFAGTNIEYSKINRQFYIPFADPFNDLEANALTYLTLTEFAGFLTDYLNTRLYLELDQGAYGRLAQIIFELYSICLWGYLSHEKAHAKIESKYGGYSSRLDFNDWSLGVPKYNSEINYYPTSKQLIEIVAAGLNQETYLAYLVDRMTARRISHDRAISFLVRKFSLPAYDIYSGGKIDVVKEGDLGIYSAELKKSGIDLSPQAISLQSALCGLLSIKTWDSFKSIINYLGYGQRSTDATLLRFGGQEFTPPLFQYILTERGGFINATSTWLNKDLEFSFGSDLGQWTGDVNNIRFGIKLNRLFSFGPVDFGFRGAVNFKRSDMSYNGSLAGLGLLWNIYKGYKLEAGIAYTDGDIYEKTRGNEKGVVVKATVRILSF